tara:strand:+ start:1157 stop:1939 length:783 start_codon:yes stop_codon:yes gene_type:complete
MPLYKDKVVKSENAAKVALDYKAKDIRNDLPKAEINFELEQKKKTHATSFRIDPLLAQRTGHAAEQDEKIKTEVEKMALEKLKEVEERAYKEAYDLGYKEGKEDGFKDAKNEIEEHLFQLEKEAGQLANLLPNMFEQNEAKLVEMIYAIASKIALLHIEMDDKYVINLLQKLSSGIQSDLETTVKVPVKDYEFIEQMGAKFSREVKLPKNAKLESDESLSHGECIIETNYGVVDASLDARIEKLWNVIKDSIPKSYSEGA